MTGMDEDIVRPRVRFGIRVADLLAPDGYWPYPNSLEEAFQTFRWMVATGRDHRVQERWGTRGVTELLSATSAVGLRAVAPIRSLDDLRTRFQHAVLSRNVNAPMRRWREDRSIHPDSTLRIPYKAYKPFSSRSPCGSEAEIEKSLDRMTSPPLDQRMAVWLNPIHPDCLALHGVAVAVHESGFTFHLSYGDHPRDTMGSSWHQVIARTRGDEPFLDTFERAEEAFDLLVHGRISDDEPDLADMETSWDERFVSRILEQISETNTTEATFSPPLR